MREAGPRVRVRCCEVAAPRTVPRHRRPTRVACASRRSDPARNPRRAARASASLETSALPLATARLIEPRLPYARSGPALAPWSPFRRIRAPRKSADAKAAGFFSASTGPDTVPSERMRRSRPRMERLLMDPGRGASPPPVTSESIPCTRSTFLMSSRRNGAAIAPSAMVRPVNGHASFNGFEGDRS